MSDTVHRDVVDAAAVALQRARKAAQDRGDKPLSTAAAAKNMRAFGTAMEEGTPRRCAAGTATGRTPGSWGDSPARDARRGTPGRCPRWWTRS